MIDRLLTRLRNRKIRLWLDGDSLRFSAPAGALTDELKDEIRESRSEIVAFLRAAEAGARKVTEAIPRRSSDDPPPLSFPQERLWFLHQLDPGTSAYNVQTALHLSGNLDVGALHSALEGIIRRHESLRTCFPTVERRPVQRVKEVSDLTLKEVDLSNLALEDAHRNALEVASEEHKEPFDLEKGPVIRFALIRLTDHEHVLLVTMHHIVWDGWSLGVLNREISALYNAEVREEASSLPDLPIQYADYASWQREWLDDEVVQEHLAYWKEHLAGTSALELPPDRPRPPIQTFAGALETFALPPVLEERLRKLAQAEGVTPAILFQAAFNVLLHRYTQETDIVVGSPIANRGREEIEGLIGFFVNNLVMHTDLSGDPSAREVVHRVREVALNAYDHQDLPFERLVTELQPIRDPSRNPLFQIVFAVQNMPGDDVSMDGLTSRQMELDLHTTRFDLECHILESETGSQVVWAFNVDLFERDTIQRLGRHYLRLLEKIVADPDMPIGILPMLEEDERAQLLKIRGPSVSYSRDRTVSQLFEDGLKSWPNAVALRSGEKAWTFQDLNGQANRLAHWLRDQGVGPDTIVGLLMDRGIEMVWGALAAMKAGGAYVAIDPGSPRGRVEFILGDADCAVLLAHGVHRDRIPTGTRPVLYLDEEVPGLEHYPRSAPRNEATSEDLAYVIYTSGSTGRPKGVAVEHRALVNVIGWHHAQCFEGPGERTTQIANVAFDASLLEIWPALTGGAELHFPPADAIADPGGLVAWLYENEITISFLPTPLAEAVMAEEWPADANLRFLLTGGDRLRKAPGTSAPFRLINHYGPAEAVVMSTTAEVDPEPATPHIGHPIQNVWLRVADDRMNPVPIGVPGELLIGGEGLARGYINRPDLTQERFIDDPLGGGGQVYRTGDIVRYRSDGNLEFLWRSDFQVKIRGYRIELGEIEAVLGEDPSVREVVAIVREDEPGDQRLVAYVVPEEEWKDEELIARWRRHLQRQVPAYMVPAAFVTLDQLPLNPNGKVDRRALPVPSGSRKLDTPFEAPHSPTERMVASIWEEVLHKDTVGRHDNFFELGGHSLLATGVVSRLREALGREIPLIAIFEEPTVAELADRIDRIGLEPDDGTEDPPIAPRSGTGPVPLSFAQRRLWVLHQLDTDSFAYNIPITHWLRGPLDKDVLEQALREIQRRHESLRTTFAVVDGEAVQVIAPNPTFSLTMEDLRNLGPDQKAETLDRLVRDEVRRPFDLVTGPLFRGTLIRTEDEVHVLVIVLHHIIADGWSVVLLNRELGTIFEAFVAGKPCPLPEIPIQYSDYAVWQRERLSGEYLDRELSYWRAQFQEAEQLDLPLDRPRPPVQTFRGELLRRKLPGEWNDALERLGSATGTTASMIMQAAFALLLSRWSGQTDITVGTPIANRDRRESEETIGFFVNSLAIRTDLSGDPTFTELLDRVRTKSLEAFSHQDLPFEMILEDLQPTRDPSRYPLFQVWYSYLNLPATLTKLGHLAVEPFELRLAPTRFDLEFNVVDAGPEKFVVLSFNAGLFQSESMERFSEHFKHLLGGALERPDAPVSELSKISPEEANEILHEWNDTAVDYPEEATLHGLFENQAQRRPKATAVRFQDRSLTYRELDAQASCLAAELRNRGVEPSDLVGVVMERSIEMVVALLGTLKAGAAYLPIEPDTPSRRTTSILKTGRPKVVLTQSRFEKAVRGAWAGGPGGPVDNILDMDTWLPHGSATEGVGSGPSVSPDDLAYVMFTSGSTGQPKGVMVHHRAICNRLFWMQSEYGLDPEDKVLQKTSFAFDVSVWEFFWPLMVGAELVVAVPEGHKDPRYLAKVIEETGITTMHFVPSMMRVFLSETPGTDDTSLRRVFSSGEALPSELARSFLLRFPGVELHNLYGPTEAAVDVTYYRCRPDEERTHVPIGRPVANTRLYVLDEDMQPVPVGVFGELYLGGVQVAKGYLGQPELTAARFLKDPWAENPHARLYRTGDIVRYLPDGNLEFRGRNDHQVKIRGNRIECGEIETALAEDPLVNQAVVVARDDGSGETALVGYVVLSDETLEQAATEKGSAVQGHIQNWEEVYDDTYETPGQESTVSFVGWNSSYNGKPIPAEEMREWVQEICRRIVDGRPETILELGCGNGLLLFEVAPDCHRYVGTDISRVAVEGVKAHAAELGLENVSATQQAAHDFSGLEGERFDLVLINSVIQLFPGLDYLQEVLDGALAHTEDGGRIIVGDVRSLPLLRAFYSSLAQTRLGADASRQELVAAVRRMMKAEEELVVDPAFFLAWAEEHSRVTSVRILPKGGRAENELSRFRYDVVISLESHGPGSEPGAESAAEWFTWSPSLSLSGLEDFLSKGCSVGVTDLPDARVQEALESEAAIFGPEGNCEDPHPIPAPTRKTGVHPEDLKDLGTRLGFSTEIRISEEPGHLDVLFSVQGDDSPGSPPFPPRRIQKRSRSSYSNDPLRKALGSTAVPLIRERLAESLPDFMVPVSFVVLEELPLTPSGKLDRKALPKPSTGRRDLSSAFVLPRNETERSLAEIWAELLGIEDVGIEDNFFDLGGHSLMATRLTGRIRSVFGVDLPLRSVFASATIESLGMEITKKQEARATDLAPAREGQEILKLLRSKGATLSAKNGKLVLNAPSGVVTPEIREAIARSKDEILSILQSAGASQKARGIPTVPRDQQLRASPAQQRLWFLDRLAPGSPVYNISAAFRTRAFDEAVLGRAVDALIERHEILRTSFHDSEDGPLLRPHPPTPGNLEVVDLRGLDEASQEEAVERIVKERGRMSFDLTDAPLMRVTLVKLNQRESVLVWSMHHIVSDGWSLEVIERDLEEISKGLMTGRTPDLPDLPIQFADFAAWQWERQESDRVRSQLAFWQEHLGGELPTIELPTDRPRPPIQTFSGRRKRMKVGQPVSGSLRDLSRTEGVTLFMTLLAAFKVFLSRFTGETDIVLGVPTAGRDQPELENLVGFFVNNLVLRTDLTDQPSFRTLLHRVKRNVLAAHAHQDVPFDQLVEALKPQRSMSHPPLFQVMFNSPMSPQKDRWKIEEAEEVEFQQGTARFDLTVEFFEFEQDRRRNGSADDLIFHFEYNTDLFDESTVVGFQDAFLEILESVVSNPDAAIDEIPIVPDAEKRLLLEDWTRTDTEYPRDRCIHDLIRDTAERHPDKIAVEAGGVRLSYAELLRRSEDLARHLRGIGVERGILVGLCLDRSVSMPVAVLGILLAGGAYVPLDPAYPADRISFMLEDSGAPVLVTQKQLLGNLPKTDARVVLLDSEQRATTTEWEVGDPDDLRRKDRVSDETGDGAGDPGLPGGAPGSSDPFDEEPRARPSDLAYVIYTSGSTGRPKGVQIQHRALVNFLHSMAKEPGFGPDDRLLAVTTISFDIAGLELFLPLLVGGTVIVANRAQSVDPMALADLIQESGTTVMQATPATWRLLIKSGWAGKPDLRILCGGEPLDRELADQLVPRGSELWNMYGPTETTVWSSVQLVDENTAWPVSVGRPIANTTMFVLDTKLGLSPIGVTGELFIGGDGVAKGYLNRPELTAERFIPNPLHPESDGRLYRTGDAARFRRDGTVEILGRLDHQVKVRGFRIELGEIESVLAEHPSVAQAAVAVREDIPGDQRLVAYVEPTVEGEVEPVTLQGHLKAALPDYMVPTLFVELSSLPLTPNGKLDRKALPSPADMGLASRSNYEAPTTRLETTITSVWEEVLHVDRVGIRDNFFDLGGHSLLAVRVQGLLKERLDTPPALLDLFQFPTVSSLAKHLAKQESPEKSGQASEGPTPEQDPGV